MKNLICLALFSCLLFPKVYAISPIVPNTAKTPPSQSDWVGYPLLKHIASCESWGDPNKLPRQFLSDGSVLHGKPNPNDIGLAQINLPTWDATAKKLGLNIYTYDGNLAMAKWIFNHYGSGPWKYSKGCWGA
jgi:hypothetical protein